MSKIVFLKKGSLDESKFKKEVQRVRVSFKKEGNVATYPCHQFLVSAPYKY